MTALSFLELKLVYLQIYIISYYKIINIYAINSKHLGLRASAPISTIESSIYYFFMFNV